MTIKTVKTSTAQLLSAGVMIWVAATTITMATSPAGEAPQAHMAPGSSDTLPNLVAFENASGHHRTFNVNGAIDLTGPFFHSFGTNDRSCGTCHQASDAWTVTPTHIQARFDATKGLDPIFRTNDGATSPLANVQTIGARRAAYGMLLSKGLIRVGIGMPANAEFDLVGVEDPYGYASAAELSLFRRPLPATNLGFLATVMWDGRETFAGQTMHFDLSDQANAATLGHAAALNPLTDAERESIVLFELGLFTAQSDDRAAGELNAFGAKGGPVPLASLPFSIGINDVLGPTFDPRVFRLFDAWKDLKVSHRSVEAGPPHRFGVRDHGPDPDLDDARRVEARLAVARGQEIFNTRPITISGVNGLNDVLGVGALKGTCTTCHDTPNVGNHSVGLPLDIGLTTEARRTPDLPLYTFRNKTTGEIVRTTDPGRALITGQWKHMSLFKGPILRALAARPPYFHNGSAATLEDVVDFYDVRFGLGLSRQEKSDLIAFLRTL